MSDNRRSFIKKSAAGVVSAPLLTSASTSHARNDGAYDVIVIGAGFAGVTAARETSLRGHHTLLLDARPRIGGRTLTLPLAGHDLDLGGTWIGWSQPHVWAEIMRYEIDIVERAASATDLAIWFEDGKRRREPYAEFAPIWQQATDLMYAPAREALPRPFDPLFAKDIAKLDAMDAASVINGLKLKPVERDVALSLAAIDAHARPQESSYLDQLRWFALGDFDVWNMFDNLARYRIKGGTKALIERMHADSDVETRLGTPVTAVKQNKDGVEITTAAGETLRARRVIAALPMNCYNDIKFEPGLSAAKTQQSAARHTGSGTKLYARIKGRERMVECTGTYDMPLNFLWTEYDDADSQILVGFGSSKDYLDIHSESAVHDAVHRYLPDAQVLEFFTYDWNVDPYAKGTWCMYRPGVLTEHFTDLKRPEGKVFFAGGDIAEGWRGFIDGAIESGLRTGRQVADALS